MPGGTRKPLSCSNDAAPPAMAGGFNTMPFFAVGFRTYPIHPFELAIAHSFSTDPADKTKPEEPATDQSGGVDEIIGPRASKDCLMPSSMFFAFMGS